jgi:DNA-binding transcriptional regulator YiaG
MSVQHNTGQAQPKGDPMALINELKAEISRLARREIRKELESVRRVNSTQRERIATLRKDVDGLEKKVKRLEKVSPIEEVIEAEEQDGRASRWITGPGVKSLRKKLGITQVQLAKLCGVSDQAVVNWEKSEGKIRFRQQETAQTIQQLRSSGKKQVREMLGE